jgi:hypothetical protein
MKPTLKPLLTSDDILKRLQQDIKVKDCDPSENVWALMKLRINKEPYISINNFIERIEIRREKIS